VILNVASHLWPFFLDVDADVKRHFSLSRVSSRASATLRNRL